MLDHKTRIFGQVRTDIFDSGGIFLRRPPRNVLDRLLGHPTDFGFAWLDMAQISASEYLSLGKPIAAVLATISGVGGDATL